MHTSLPKRALRWLWAGVAWSLLLVLASMWSGCILPRDGTLALQCTADVDCQDDNPCTSGRCLVTGFCEIDILEGVPLPQQAGDCRLAECVSGEVRLLPVDDPPDDGNPCTLDFCDEGEPKTSTANLEGDACQLGDSTGVCRSGECIVLCTNDGECDDANSCTNDRCNLGVSECVFEPLDNVPAPDQVDYNCRLEICVDGELPEESLRPLDPTDLPEDFNDCTEDLCTETGPDRNDRPAGFPCETPDDQFDKLCNGNGTCVQCLGPNNCTHLPSNSECAQRTCSATGDCGQNFTPNGTPVNAQTNFDCKINQCDGAGNVVTVADPNDLPLATSCQSAACNGTTPIVTDLPAGTACGASGVCDGLGACVGCNQPIDCGVDTDCRVWQCQSNTCVANDTAAGTPVTNQTAGDCLEVQCDGNGQAQPVPVPNDPFDDMNECTDDVCVNGTPLNNPLGQTDPCSQGFCNGAGVCVQCNNAGQCPQGDGVCEFPACTNNVCSIEFDMMGAAAPPSEQTAGDCQTEVCDGMGNVAMMSVDNNADVPVDNNQCTDDQCNAGVPSNPLEPPGTTCSTGVCNGVPPGVCVECVNDTQCAPNETCDTVNFICELDDGQTCGQNSDCFSGHCVDGRCCNNVCSGLCEACDLGGALGVCTPVGAGADPDGECVDGACNGAGLCASDDGQACNVGSDCLSGNCVDGVCCDTSCGGTCEACDLSGSVGTCSLVPASQDPDNECVNGACNGAGACRLDDGQTCLAAGQCLSGNCVDAVCCNAACGGTCEACDIPSLEGTCTPYATGLDPENECSMVSAADVCNGSGQCQCVDGQSNGNETGVDCGGPVCGACGAGQGCAGPSDCVSGVCTGGFCVAASCGDGVQNGAEVCDFNDPANPCCANDCMGIAAAGTICGAMDPDGLGCQAADQCDGMGTGVMSCGAAVEPDGTACTDDMMFCTGLEKCSGGVCVSEGDPCLPLNTTDASCSDSCDEGANTCTADDPNGTACNDGMGGVQCVGGTCSP